MLYTAALLLSFLNSAFAECPNACSAHGKCGAYDMCSCYRNWMANDCSERICQFGMAHVDVPKGDLDASSGALTMTRLLINGTNAVVANVATDSFMYPKGTSEQFPDMVDSAMAVLKNTAHDYSECSSKGSCDRSTGSCQCFEGYSGSACQRASCPDSGAGVCSGHGTCENIKTISRWDYGNVYKLWDEGATMGCYCDGGFSGADCSEKMCKTGVDPLYLDSYQTYRYNNWTYAVYTTDATAVVVGNYSLVYTDTTGEAWQTKPIDIAAACKDVVLALEDIPNNVIPLDTVECFEWPADVWFTAVYEPVSTAHLTMHAKYTIAFPSNPGATEQLAIKTKLDGARDTLYSTVESTSSLETKVFSNGFYGEEYDFVPDLCEGVLISFAAATPNTVSNFDTLVALSTADLKLFKTCLGDNNGDTTDNVEVENWDHGSVSAPHLIKLVDATQDNLLFTDTDLSHHDTGYMSSNTYVCDQNALINTDGTCQKADPPGFYAAIYWDTTDSNFVVLSRPKNDYISTAPVTTFHVYTTTGRLVTVDSTVAAFNTWTANTGLINSNLLTNKLFTTSDFDTTTTRLGVDCETSTAGLECLQKEDYMMVMSNTKGYAAAPVIATALSVASNPVYPQIYQVKKISTEPVPVADFATSDQATNTFVGNALTPVFVRNQIVLDRVVNAQYHLDTETPASDSSAQLFKFYPPDNKYAYAGECSNRGICDTATGGCTCFAGFDGDSCQRIDALSAR